MKVRRGHERSQKLQRQKSTWYTRDDALLVVVMEDADAGAAPVVELGVCVNGAETRYEKW